MGDRQPQQDTSTPAASDRIPLKHVASGATDCKDVGNFKHDGQQKEGKTVEKLLMELIDLQRSQIQSKAGKDEKIKNDWKLAAAVFDRMLLIFFGIILVGGTFIFVLIFASV